MRVLQVMDDVSYLLFVPEAKGKNLSGSLGRCLLPLRVAEF